MPVDISLCVMVMGQPECYNYNECNNLTSLKSLLPDNLIWPRLRQNAVMKYRGSWAELNYERLISVLYKKVFYEDWCLAALDSVERLDKLSLLYPLLSSFHLNNWAESVVLTQRGDPIRHQLHSQTRISWRRLVQTKITNTKKSKN